MQKGKSQWLVIFLLFAIFILMWLKVSLIPFGKCFVNFASDFLYIFFFWKCLSLSFCYCVFKWNSLFSCKAFKFFLSLSSQLGEHSVKSIDKGQNIYFAFYPKIFSFFFFFLQRTSTSLWGEWMGVMHADEIE